MVLWNYGVCQKYLPRGGAELSRVADLPSLVGWQVLLLQNVIKLQKTNVICVWLSDEDLLAQWIGLFSGREVHAQKHIANYVLFQHGDPH